MEPELSSIYAPKLRIRRERVYYALVVLISIFAWFLLAFSIFRQFAAIGTPTTMSQEEKELCYVRDIYSEKVTSISEKNLYPGEKCLRWNELTIDEQSAIQKANTDVVEKVLASITTPVYILLLFFFTLFSQLLAIAYIRMNSIKVSEKQFPELWEAMQRLSSRLHLKKQPDMFIMNGDGVLNAFATRLVFRKLLVVYSNLAEALLEGNDQEQLEAVLGHELGHHALGHTDIINWFLAPGMILPYLGKALSRAREYSADQVMKALVPQRNAGERALVKLAAGKTFGNKVNIAALKDQAYEEKGFFSWLAEILSTHPFLPKRLAAIQDK